MHEEELPRQALYILPAHTALHHWYVQQVKEFLKLATREDNSYRLHVNCPPKELLDAGPVTLSCQEVLQAHQVFLLSR